MIKNKATLTSDFLPTVPSTEQLVSIVATAREKAIKESYKYAKVVVARNDGYFWHDGSSEGKSEIASKPSRRKIIEIIKNNPTVTEIGFQGTIKVGNKVGDELEIADDWSVILWKPTNDLFTVGMNFEYKDDNGKYLYTIVNKSETETYKNRTDNDDYVYFKFVDKKYGSISEGRSKIKILKDEFDNGEAFVVDPQNQFGKGGKTKDDKMNFDVPDIYEIEPEMGAYFKKGGQFGGKTAIPPELFKITREKLAQKHWLVKVIVGKEQAKFFFKRMQEVDEFIDSIKHLADEVYVSKEMHYEDGGKIGFAELSRKVAQRYIGKAVAPKYQSEYGKRYDESEAKEVGNKVAGTVYWNKKNRK